MRKGEGEGAQGKGGQGRHEMGHLSGKEEASGKTEIKVRRENFDGKMRQRKRKLQLWKLVQYSKQSR